MALTPLVIIFSFLFQILRNIKKDNSQGPSTREDHQEVMSDECNKYPDREEYPEEDDEYMQALGEN